MKIRTMFVIASVAMCLFLSLSVSAQVSNGSFEDGVTEIDPIGFTTVSGVSNNTVTSWTVEDIDYIGDYWQASEGLRSIDLNGYFTQGRVRQTLATTVGYTYQITFDMSGNPDNGAELKTMDVSAAGTTTSYSFMTGSNTHENMMWETHTFTFTAIGASTELLFQTTTAGAWGPALDNVRITNITGQICHRDSKPGFKTLTVGVAAIPAHMAHGDLAGPCVGSN